jgi:hypothetical protein
MSVGLVLHNPLFWHGFSANSSHGPGMTKMVMVMMVVMVMMMMMMMMMVMMMMMMMMMMIMIMVTIRTTNRLLQHYDPDHTYHLVSGASRTRPVPPFVPVPGQ